jgi:hypothetical protein
LIQQDPTGSVSGCLGRRFPGRCANFKPISLPKKLANGIWRPVVGLTGLSARDADIDMPTNWRAENGDNVRVVVIKSR